MLLLLILLQCFLASLMCLSTRKSVIRPENPENPPIENQYTVRVTEEKSQFHFQPIDIRQVEEALG